MIRTVEELVRRMKPLMHQWHQHIELPNKKGARRKGNDGDAGNTLEALLDVPENNLRLPDFGEIELKTQKFEGKSSLLTLFHKEPLPKASVPKLLKCMGWRHELAGADYPENEMSFRSTTYGHRFSDRGLKIDVTDDKIMFIYDPTKVNRACADRTGKFENYGAWADDLDNRTPHYRQFFPIYYNLADVVTGFQNKLGHTLLVFRKTKTTNGIKYHWYEEAYLMKDVKSAMIPVLIREGAMAIDFDARTHHNHGTKFRIKKDQAHRLFTDFAMME